LGELAAVIIKTRALRMRMRARNPAAFAELEVRLAAICEPKLSAGEAGTP
jgi:hypothetical protein